MKHSSKHGNTARADVAFFPTIPFSKHQMIALGLIVFILLTLFQRAYRSNSTEAPHPMPPHPSLRERIQRGEVKLPIYMTNPAVARTKGIDSAAGPRTPRIGAIQTLAVVVDFSDKVRTVTASFFDSLIFAAPVAGRGSVYDYFDEISYGPRVNAENLLDSRHQPREQLLVWQHAVGLLHRRHEYQQFGQ